MGNEAGANLPQEERHALCTPQFTERLDLLFTAMDIDGNGQLSKSEVVEAFERAKKNANEARMFFRLMDKNQDGYIQRQEFDNFWIMLRTESTEEDVLAKLDEFLEKVKQRNQEEEEKKQQQESSVAPPKITVDDFEFYKNVGEGSFGQVYLALFKEKNQFVAIKQLHKADLIRKDKIDAVMREKQTLQMLKGRQFIVDLKMTFMDTEHLYFVFEHCKYGTLSNLITQKGKLDPSVSIYFAASIVEGLQQCFDHKIMHRDLKPENILIDENKQIKIVSTHLSVLKSQLNLSFWLIID